ncbi:hypothetical protein GE09DRAFT_1065478 [Coniochaeta sp. 2T2.1]|nr:hypothetical protein GE09DRAFT_1065478 [Coniochaeta sp. 2T2.1]
MAPGKVEARPPIADAVPATKKQVPAIVASIKTASYPTRSLDFLRRLEESKLPKLDGEKISKTPSFLLDIIVVGAGIGGLATSVALARRGHTVTVLEQAPALAEVGAGIQIPPNSSRLLHSWGMEPLLASKAVEPRGMTFRRWATGRPIAYTKLVPDFREKFQAPYYVVHRAHLHEALHETAVKLGVTIKLNHRVAEYDESVPSVTTSDGTTMRADLIVAADGVNSTARQVILGGEVKDPIQTGFAVYRATVEVEKMKCDPDTAWLLKEPALNVWIGPERHVMSYTIDAGKSFNMVLSHVDGSDPSGWVAERAIDDMRAQFTGWDPVLTKIIAMIDKTMKWPLMSGDPTIRSWLSPSGKMLMLGDAAHAMMPYMSQGAAMAVEDGAALAEALAHASSQADVPRALAVFDRVRRKRAGQMQEASLVNGKIWHFDDGPEQAARDEAMRPEVEGRFFAESANQWSDPVTQAWAYGYDAEEDVRVAREQ